MLEDLLAYKVGNEHSPTDPWGKSELAIHPDGSCWLSHRFSRGRGRRSWLGRVVPQAMEALSAGLERAGFGQTEPPPPAALVPGATLRRLSIDADGPKVTVAVDWHHTSELPGYAEAFDVIDAIIRQLSGETVKYPTQQRGAVVKDAAEFSAPIAAILATAGRPVRGDGLARAELEQAITQRRVLEVCYWSTMGDGEAWYESALELGFDRDGNPVDRYLVFPRPIAGVLGRPDGHPDWDETSYVWEAFGLSAE